MRLLFIRAIVAAILGGFASAANEEGPLHMYDVLTEGKGGGAINTPNLRAN